MNGQIDIPALEPGDLPKIALIQENISHRFIRERRIVPIDFKDRILSVAMANPTDKSAIDALRVATSSSIKVFSCDAAVLEEYICKFYGQDQNNIGNIIDNMNDPDLQFIKDEEEDIGHLKDLASEAPVIKLVNLFITRAVEGRASDIHIEPFKEELRIRYRIDGVLHNIELLPKKLQAAIVSRIKIMAKLNIAERRLPQDGRIRLKVGEKDIDLRVSSIPVLYGESVVMRILDKDSLLIDLEHLGFHRQIRSSFEQLIRKPNGIILVTGPTGSGKTTTLYGALERINSPDKKIITVEDPVEYQLAGINQIHVKPQIGLNFPNILRHIVRQDPDIIMIGEIRDMETAEIAIQSALTGHLVFSTLHTNDAPSALTRLIDLGVEVFLLASTIRGILAQRLVRVICPACKTIDLLDVDNVKTHALGLNRQVTFYRGTGCEACTHTGYFGRMGIFELLVIDDAMQQLISKNPDAARIRETARRNGMRTLIDDGGAKIAAGQTTISEVYRVTQEV